MPATTTPVEDYLASLPDNQRAVLEPVRDTVRKNLPKGYEELMQGKFITYVIPRSRYPKTYNGQPLQYAALAAQKNYYTLYLMVPYGDEKELAQLQDGFRKAGKKLDMGKSCIRFKKLDDLPLDVIGESVARTSVDDYIRGYESVKRK
ncbi:MAG TPA: DUF1801 domain-containing protein [Gemmatimonadaceae bacterium]|nr:DUF1801 domain-containing protein [Gemmatimonadaceae bacterium]